MSTSISLPQPRTRVKKNVAYSIPSSSSEKMRLIPIETQSRVNHYPNEAPTGMPRGMQLPVNYPNIVQEVVYHPPQSRFPITVCGVHKCGIVLTRQKDGNRPVCQRHAIEIDMIRRSNTRPLSHLPQPRRGNERETRISKPTSILYGQVPQHVDIGPPRHKLHALTPVQRSLLAQTDGFNGFGTIDPRVLTKQPALPQPSKPPMIVNPYPEIPERLDTATVEAAVAYRRAIERAARPRARGKLESQKFQNLRPPPARGADYPFAGDANDRTVYSLQAVKYDPYPPVMQPVDTAGVSGLPQPIIPPQVVMEPPIEQCRAIPLPLGPSAPSNGGSIPGQNSPLGKRKRRREMSVSEAEDERPRRHQASRSVSEPLLSLSSSNEMKIRGWEGDMDVDVKKCKGKPPMEFDLVTAVGNTVEYALLSLNLDELELVYPEPVANIRVPEGYPYPNIVDKQEKVAPEVIDLTADDRSIAISHTSTSQSTERSNNPYLAIHIPHLNSGALQIPKISSNSKEPSQSRLQSGQTQAHPLQSPPLSCTSSDSNTRTCGTAGCPGLVKSDSTTTRCYKCVMSDWKARKEATLKPNNDSTASPSSSGLTLRLKPIKLNKQSKRVTWADGYRSGNEGEMEEDEKRALEEDMRREEEDYIPGWDSDLTDLKDSSEESSDSSGNSSDESEDTAAPFLRSLKIRIPPRLRPLSDINAPPFESRDAEEEPPVVSSTPDEVSATIAIAEDDTTSSPDQMRTSPPQVSSEKSPSFPVAVVTIEDDTTSSSNLIEPSSPQILSEKLPPPTSTQTQESDTKPTLPPRIRITLSQISKLRASSSSASLSSVSPLSPVISSSTLTNSSASPSSAPELEAPQISESMPIPIGRTCAIRKCGRALPVDYNWKCCPTCRTHNRKYQRGRLGCQERYVGNEYDRVKSVPPDGSKDIESTSPSKPTDTFEPVPLRSFITQGSNYKIIDIHDLLVPKARICTIRSCRHLLPGPKDYKWKMCHPCRERTTRTRRIRQIKAVSGGIVDPVVIEAEVPALQPLLQDSSRILHNRCANVDCGVKLKQGKELTSDSLVECNQCLWRRMSPDERKSNPLELHDQVLVVFRMQDETTPREDSPSNGRKPASNPCPRHDFPPEKPRPASPYPEYLTLSQLLSNFHQLFLHFLQAQSYYVSYNEARDNPRGKSIAKFSFEGEFSSIAQDLQVMKREKEVFATVEKVKEEIERLGGLKFDPSRGATSIAYDGFVTRYSCQNHVPISLPVPQSNLYLKVMRGELEVAVLPVDTHRFLPGQRTVVRFRLVG